MNTAQDLVHFIISGAGGGAQDGEHAAVRHAVMHGVREVMQSRDWLWHMRTGSFTTQQLQTTASLTAGSKDIVVADPTGFYPGRAISVPAYYFPTPVRIAFVNGTTVTLDAAASQTISDVTVMPQTYYDLPADLKNIDTLITNTVGTLHCQITPQEWQRLEINTRGAGEPYYYTVMRSDRDPNRYQIRFVGVPTDATVVHYTYRTTPPTIKYMGYERLCRQGTVSLSMLENGATVIGEGTSFPQDVAGAFIRFGSPGMEADPVGSTTPYVAERRIEAWLSQSKLVLSGAMNPVPFPHNDTFSSTTFDGGVVGEAVANTAPIDATTLYSSDALILPAKTKYSISHPIDASPQMWTAILSACELWYARMAGKPANEALVIFTRDLRLAIEADVVTPRSGKAKGYAHSTPRSAGWYSTLRPDVQ